MSQGSYEYTLALNFVFSYKKIGGYNNEQLNKEKSEIERIKKNYSAHESKFISMLSDQAVTFENLKKLGNAQVESFHNAQKRRVRRYRNIYKSLQEKGSGQAAQAVEELAAAKMAWFEQVDLQETVHYWKQKEALHKKSKWIGIAAVFTSIALTFLMPIAYYKLGGLSHFNMADTQKESPKDSKPESPPTAVSSSALTPSEIMINSAANLAGAALLVALMSILVRISLRNFNAHSFLEIDAAERQVMIKTYLSLMLGNKLSSDNDRKLILETIFRASQTQSLPETQVHTPLELVIKAVSSDKS
jgi:hypothetical protein